MSHTGRYGDVDYGRWAKGAFLCGIAMFVVGVGGEYVLELTRQDVPDWVHVLLVDLSLVGVLVALLLPIFFGIVMPLTE